MDHNLEEYTQATGEKFIDYYVGELQMGTSRTSLAKNIIGKLNRLLQGLEGRGALLPGLLIKFELPQNLMDTLDDYLSHSAKKGNKHTTIRNKYLICGRFLKYLSDLGCTRIQDATGELIQTAFLTMGNMGCWDRLSPFFLFLFDEGILKQNYSTLIRKRRRAMPMPTVYSPEEILSIENSIDLTTPNGIRNYAIILLITRYGIRSADIAALTSDNIDFDNNRLHFIQQKTEALWEAELLPEVKAALLNYVENIRPDFGSYQNIFIKLVSPYAPLSFNAINIMIQRQFTRVGIGDSERSRGSRAFRSSVASNMINDGIPTEIVRKVLGHETRHALRHYARIDIESMRLCPLPVPEPSGAFERLLFSKEATLPHV